MHLHHHPLVIDLTRAVKNADKQAFLADVELQRSNLIAQVMGLQQPTIQREDFQIIRSAVDRELARAGIGVNASCRNAFLSDFDGNPCALLGEIGIQSIQPNGDPIFQSLHLSGIRFRDRFQFG